MRSSSDGGGAVAEMMNGELSKDDESTSESKTQGKLTAESQQSSQSLVVSKCAQSSTPLTSTPVVDYSQTNDEGTQDSTSKIGNCENESSKQCEKPVKKPEREPLVVSVDHDHLHWILDSLVRSTDNCSVEVLERLHCSLYRCITGHQNELDKTALLKDLEGQIERFKHYAKS